MRFGFNVEDSYMILKDGSTSEDLADIDKSWFEETLFDQIATPVKTLKLTYCNEDSHYAAGLIVGVKLFDKNGNSICKTGYFGASDKSSTSIVLEEGERIIGMKSGKRGETDELSNFDVQFFIGQKPNPSI